MDPAERVEMEAMQFLKPINEATERGNSEVQQFYQNAVVLITGGTGFIGKQLLEKLLRSCGLKKAFVLIRPKKGKSIKTRLQEMLNDPVFEAVRTRKPDVMSRIVGVEGDVAEIRVGISDGDWNMIVDEVDTIFHVAATIRFDENIRKAAITNVRGTREILQLGKACKNIRSFVHVSTAYSHATVDRVGDEVQEQFYKSPIPAETLLSLVESVNEKRLDTMTQSLISGWPNTYTFTKAVAEALLQAESGNLPVCIVRPSIVMNSYREPVPGWLDASGAYGPCGIVAGVALGVMRVWFTDISVKMSFVPVDFVNNAIIAAGWNTARHGLRGTQEPLIYNIDTTRCGVTSKNLIVPLSTLCRDLVSPFSLWYCYLIHTKSRLLYWFYSWLLHFIPAYIVDAFIHVFNVKKPQGLKSFIHIYTKIEKLTAVLSYFATHEWYFKDTNLQNLWQSLSSTDKTIFNFDVESIDWVHYCLMLAIGTRKYIIKDGLKGTKKAIAKQKWLKLANYLVLIGYVTFFWFVCTRFCLLCNYVLKKCVESW